MNFKTEVNETPCYCRVLAYVEPLPMAITGTGFGDCEPPDPGEFEYELLDLHGNPARQLESEVTDEDDERLEREYLKHPDEYWSDV
jgi:hypothetical protein